MHMAFALMACRIARALASVFGKTMLAGALAVFAERFVLVLLAVVTPVLVFAVCAAAALVASSLVEVVLGEGRLLGAGAFAVAVSSKGANRAGRNAANDRFRVDPVVAGFGAGMAFVVVMG